MGRRTKLLNKDVKDIILRYIRNGNYIKTACMAAGVSERVYYQWQEKSERADGNGNEVYVQFFQELKKVEAENIARNIQNIQDAGDKPQSWPASAWLLERKYPSDYGKRLELEVGPSKVLIAIQEQALKALEGKPVCLLTSGDE